MRCRGFGQFGVPCRDLAVSCLCKQEPVLTGSWWGRDVVTGSGLFLVFVGGVASSSWFGQRGGDAVVCVASGVPLSVDPWRWDELRMPVGGESYAPAVMVHAGVVVRTYQHQVAQRGAAAVGPVDDVVCLAPGCWAGAAGKRAATIASDQRGPLLRCHSAGAAVGVQRHPERVGGDAGDLGVAGDTGQDLGWYRGAPRAGPARRTGCLSQIVEGGGDADVRTRCARAGQSAGIQHAAAQLDQSLALTLRVRAGVLDAVDCG